VFASIAGRFSGVQGLIAACCRSELSCFLQLHEAKKPTRQLVPFSSSGAASQGGRIAFPLANFSGSGGKVKKKRFPLDRKTL
jgi:hypothetical protein